MSESKSSIASRVAAGVLTAGALWALSKVPGVLQWLLKIVGSTWSHLKGTSSFPNWVLYLFVLTAIYSVLSLASRAYKPKGPKVAKYNQDSFFGVIWRWTITFGNHPSNIWAFCPYCDTRLVYTENYHNGNTETVLSCETCNQPRLRNEGDKNYLVAKIHRQIERKTRTGEWITSIKTDA